MMSNQSDVTIHPVAGRIGAEIRGVRLGDSVDPTAAAAINAALLRYKVIFFRDQNHLDDAGQEVAASLFGTPSAHPTLPASAAERNFMLEINSARGERTNTWHTDVTFVPAYPKACMLRAVLIPPFGGDTMWANTVTAFNDLSDEMKAFAETLWAVHTNAYDYAARVDGMKGSYGSEETAKTFSRKEFETEHPLVHIHPETGEKSLLLGSFVKRIVDMSSVDSGRIYALFQDAITRPENTVRWRWQLGDVAVWDNRATQHYGIDDYNNADRIMRRVALTGIVPKSVRGELSRLRQTTANG